VGERVVNCPVCGVLMVADIEPFVTFDPQLRHTYVRRWYTCLAFKMKGLMRVGFCAATFALEDYDEPRRK